MEFVDFAEYVADYGTESLENLDQHFKPILSHCDPCKFPFNYITRLETFYTDARWIIESKLNVSANVISSVNVINKSKDPAALIKDYYFSQLKPDVIERILSIYKLDMETFGYTFNKTTLTAGGWEKETSLT
ncbi:carbohydrate sulfotransferase 11-like [Clavelina lepadiformis]|uniref:carbohydrate sulfotransferase 11-like n=1 Tax=Clavelina lepadiformis TaxID=159417 RepID=UPI0040423164